MRNIIQRCVCFQPFAGDGWDVVMGEHRVKLAAAFSTELG